MKLSSFKAEIVSNLRVFALLVGAIFSCFGLAMLAVQAHRDLAWVSAEARIESIGVLCNMKWVELRVARNPRRVHWKKVPCPEVAAVRAANPDTSFDVKEVPQIGVSFMAGARLVEATGQYNPDHRQAPKVGDTVSIKYDSNDPRTIAWSSEAAWMYPMAGIIILIGLALLAAWWLPGRSAGGGSPAAGMAPEPIVSRHQRPAPGARAGFGPRPTR